MDIEKSMLVSAIKSKEHEIGDMEYIVKHKLPQEHSHFQYLCKKEQEINSKMQTENNYLYNKNESLADEIKNMLKIYKEVSFLELEKTKEGFLKLILFKELGHQRFPKGAHVVVEIRQGKFQIISTYPQLNVSQYEEELSKTHNFTLFVSKVAQEFLAFFKSK